MLYVFIVLALAGYLGFLIDWKELRNVLGQGGWAAIGFYCVIGVLLVAVLASPEAASVPAAMHH